jgi:hypothetical protein
MAANQPTITNTLIIVHPPPEYYQDNGNLLRKYLPLNNILRIIILKSFQRIMVVFDDVLIAERTRAEIATHFRVFYGLHTEDRMLADDPMERFQYLELPQSTKNFLLSPPATIPVGWQQGVESGPTIGGFCPTVMDDFALDGGLALPESQSELVPSTPKLYEFKNPFGLDLPVVVIESINDDAPIRPMYIPRTCLPPNKD